MSKNGTIELSPKHGLNPVIPVCFWCGKEKNEIALLGRVRERNPHTGRAIRGSDIDMSMQRLVFDYEPCTCCKERFSQGVHLIEVNQNPQDDRPPISKDENNYPLYPTGKNAVIKPEVAQEVFKLDKSMLEAGKKLCLPQEIFNQLMPTNNI